MCKFHFESNSHQLLAGYKVFFGKEHPCYFLQIHISLNMAARPSQQQHDNDLDKGSGSASKSQGKEGFFKLQPGQTYSESSSNALLGLFLYSAMMFTLPLLAFFGSKQLLEEHFDIEPPYAQLAPAIIAVVIANIVIMAYVIKAYREDAKENANVKVPIELRKKRE